MSLGPLFRIFQSIFQIWSSLGMGGEESHTAALLTPVSGTAANPVIRGGWYFHSCDGWWVWESLPQQSVIWTWPRSQNPPNWLKIKFRNMTIRLSLRIYCLDIFWFNSSPKINTRKVIIWSCHVACGIFVPWPGTEPGSSAVSLNHWTAREFPGNLFLKLYIYVRGTL